MTDIDDCIGRFRECARHVFNTYFLPLDEGWHEFLDVESALFDGLVTTQIFDRSDDPTPLLVTAIVPPSGLPLCHAEAVGQRVDWQEGRLASMEGYRLRFVEFFDWAGPADPRDYRYVRTRVEAAPPGGPVPVGHDVLIEYHHARFAVAE